VWSLPNLHGDIVAVVDNSGATVGVTATYGPYGEASINVDNSHGNLDYGWLGQHQRPTETQAGLATTIEMGARQYDPVVGRFLEVDPIEGGSANDYDYVAGDPVNSFDLDGLCRWGWKCLRQKARNAANWANGSSVLGYGISRITGSKCRQNKLRGIQVCTGAKRFGFLHNQRGGTTFGSFYITSRKKVDNRLARHEAKHANQWMGGGLFALSYLGFGKRWEKQAGLRDGCYHADRNGRKRSGCR
ncbi:MAG: hypothetical protein KDA95_02470, partial [Acidimicrobiales bacterium]|nr:hypothetical protein [Acidimicrobiales bacterium]